MGREILITGEETLYRDVVAGQPKPEWKKGPSVNLSVLLFLDANTRMQVSGNQYVQLSALQTFFAQAFADIKHNHDDVYDAAGTAAQLIGELATAFNNHTANHAPAGAQVNVIEKIKYNGVEMTPDANKTVNILDEDIREILITYYSTNGALSPFQLPSRNFDRTFTGYSLGDGATDFSVTISGTTYTKATITNVVLPANVKMTINSLTLTAGYTAASASLLFK